MSAQPSPINLTAFTCSLRRLTVYAAGQKLTGRAAGVDAVQSIADALRLGECGDTAILLPTIAPAVGAVTVPADAIYISPVGDDARGDGSAARPFASPLRARDVLRQRPAGATRVVVLRGGTYHLADLGGPLVLTAQDSGTAWVADPAAARTDPAPMLGGTRALGVPAWAPWDGHGPVLVANLSGRLPAGATFQVLFGVRRLIRARTPNGDPTATSGLCLMGGAGPGEGCAGWYAPKGSAGEHFNGALLRQVNFSTPRGGLIRGDDLFSR